MILVVDASVAVKWIVPEADDTVAQALLLEADDLFAPDFLMIEVGNVLCSKRARRQLDQAQLRSGFEFVQSAVTRFIPDRELVSRAFEIAMEIDHAVHDCMYLACAESAQVRVVTADSKLIQKLTNSPYASLARPLVY